MDDALSSRDIRETELDAHAADGHRFQLIARLPAAPRGSLLWLPAMGIGAKHYIPFADALARRGIAVFVHEWRGAGSSSVRASRETDWGYRELLTLDIPASEALVAQHVPDGPRTLGGHSLGGQLACCRLGLSPESAQRLWLVGSGAPYWRAFPARTAWWLPLVYRFLPWLADFHGVLPGRRIGFGGQEARGVIRDWSRSGLSGRYAAAGVDVDLEAAMAALTLDAHAVALANDWLGPVSSLRFLLSKLRRVEPRIEVLDADALGARADHYAWMKRPDAVADALLR
ncbi:alpha/beta hydrolase family protein [Lysobacter auxotrophicus]|uniref:Alpha/beta fold hydrolase n=1 Tax=Lysobacter auxotrophicus TaxID=2992573 RepID=A0ABM8DBZ0_9GAMM|nr:alpha/beta fold hydrolase [Lysobacter auxotrophicus]BDU16093.1 alpha/beta fold hydrolase [Lysobacter auxotrophicus]